MHPLSLQTALLAMMLDYVLTFGGGEIYVWTPYPVWLIGGFLALNAGWLCGVWLVDAIRRRVA